VLGLDIIGADPLVGVSWGDVGDAGKWGFQNVVHPLGKGVATAFGAGAAAQSLENVEVKQGWLPATPSATAAAITTSTEAAAGPKKKDGSKDTPKSPIEAKPSGGAQPQPQPPSKLGRAVTIAGAVGVFGIVALILRRLWQG
jgi:hypothetical protein